MVVHKRYADCPLIGLLRLRRCTRVSMMQPGPRSRPRGKVRHDPRGHHR